MTANESKNELNEEAAVNVVDQQGLSIVWLVPIIALIFGAWLAVKAISERGEYITIKFENGRGIVPNKTEVRYKGLVAGMVKSVEPSANLDHVIVDVEMSAKLAPYLTTSTQFWLVTADISLQGVSGLDTLLSGDYINFQPDITKEGYSTNEFTALQAEPPLDVTTPGLHLTLQSDVLGSISKNSPITFKQLPIGYVSSYHYVEETKKIDISVFIEEKHAHLIKQNSQFWNVSGVQIVASLSSGIKVNTDSLASIISGGIAVGTQSYQTIEGVAKSGDIYNLHEDFQAAEMGHEIELTLAWNSGIDRGAAILYQGVTVGVVDSFSSIDPEVRQIIALAKVNPRIVPYLTNESQFYVVAPTIDLSGVSNAHSLLKGTHLSIRPSLVGEPTNKFSVYNFKPAYKYTEPGLHLVLQTNDRASLQSGSHIYYKQQPVGTIQAVETIGADRHLIHIHIEEAFQNYVVADSHFWNTSGISISGNMQGFEVKAQSLEAVLTGGIAFDNGIEVDKKMTANGDKFLLYANDNLAKQRVMLTLKVPSGQRIANKTRIMHRGAEVGAIHQIADNGKNSTLSVGLLPEYEYILTATTQFWLVEAQISLSGLADTEALIGGSYITFDASGSDNNMANSQQTIFSLASKSPEKNASAQGLQLKLIAKHANTASAGSPISYRGITVGQVDNMSLNTDEDHIDIHLTVEEQYQHLITAKTRFYNAGGINISGRLNKFVIKTESLDAILRGGISFYTPTEEHQSIAAQEKDIFKLFSDEQTAKDAGLAITVHFSDARGLKEAMKVSHQEQTVGIITRLIYNNDESGVNALILLNDKGAKLAVQGSKFWLAQTEIGLVGTKNIASLIDGGFIASMQGRGKLTTSFAAQNIPPPLESLPFGLNLKIVTPRLGSVRVGNPVLYRQVKVGEVIGVGLSDHADKVNIYINIAEAYTALVNQQSQFWNTSGFNVEAGLFSGVAIQSESIETLIAGGIAFATPENDNSIDNNVTQGHSFKLNDSVDNDWLNWQPKIDISH
ncbi:MAG: MlaD family protein [Colwellia sp.]|nr:MlaD family protein [Colwellia sp.]